MIGICHADEQNRHFMREPRHIISLSPEGIPVQPVRRFIARILHIADINDQIVFFFKTPDIIDAHFKVFFFINKDLELSFLQCFLHLGKYPFIRRKVTEDFEKHAGVFLRMDRQKLLRILYERNRRIRQFLCPFHMLSAFQDFQRADIWHQRPLRAPLMKP